MSHHKIMSIAFLTLMLCAGVAMMLRTSGTARNTFDLFVLSILVSICSVFATLYTLWSFNGGRL